MMVPVSLISNKFNHLSSVHLILNIHIGQSFGVKMHQSPRYIMLVELGIIIWGIPKFIAPFSANTINGVLAKNFEDCGTDSSFIIVIF